MNHIKLTVKNMSCKNCVKHVQDAVTQCGKYSNVLVTLKPPVLQLESESLVTPEEINSLLVGSKYKATNFNPFYGPYRAIRKFKPLILMFSLVILFALIHQSIYGFHTHIFMQYFMAGFFLLFGGLKVINWKKFVPSYRAYDYLAKNSVIYAWLYPAVEFGLGLAYYFSLALTYVNLFVVALMLQKAYSVYSKIKSGEKIQCACLGGFFSIPITRVTLAEDLLMAGMALWMLL
jgi:cation transport ATPase